MNASARDASKNEAGAGDTVPVLRCSQRSNEPYVRNPERLYCPDERQLHPQRWCLMDPTEVIDGDIQVDSWSPTSHVRVQIGDEFVDLSPVEVEMLVVWLESNKEKIKWERQQRQEQEGKIVYAD